MLNKKGRCVNLSCFSRSSSRKKGAGHIEMIASFLLFFTFVFFILLVLKPYGNTDTISGSVVSGMYDQFERETATNLTNVFIKADSAVGPGSCIKIPLPGNVFTYGLTESIVTNLADQEIVSNLNDPNLNIGEGDKRFYKVIISPDFDSGAIADCATQVDSYVMGSLLERQVVSYKKLQAMKNDYFNDYDKLKSDLGVPETFDFSILVDGVDNSDMEGVVPDQGDILANNYISEVLLTNGTVVNAIITFKVW